MASERLTRPPSAPGAGRASRREGTCGAQRIAVCLDGVGQVPGVPAAERDHARNGALNCRRKHPLVALAQRQDPDRDRDVVEDAETLAVGRPSRRTSRTDRAPPTNRLW